MNFWQNASRFGFQIPNLASQSNEFFDGTKCKKLDGKTVAAKIREQCQQLLANRVTPKLTVILVGEDEASKVYVGNKARAFSEIGFSSDTIRIPAAEASNDSMQELIQRLNADTNVHGVLVQLPLPAHLDSKLILNSIAPQKDVDGFLPLNAGLLATGDLNGVLACTPFGCMVLLAAYGIDLAGKRAVVIGRSNIVGRPMANLLIAADATVTVAHSKTPELPNLTREADILVVAAGRPGLVNSDFIKPGAVVIDVGMHRVHGKLCGDVDATSVTKVASALTPVPGGVGPLTIAMLCLNTSLAAWRGQQAR